jgi:hypothetical protein
MLFSQHEHPVFISPVYGCLIEKDQHDLQAYPHVPSLKRVQWFPGLRDLEAGEYPSSFTVVPILALDTATFAQIIYMGRNETHLGLCKKLIEINPESGESVTFFRRQPRLVVIGGETEVPPGWLDGYCASKALCVHHGADTPTTSSAPQCPGCRSAVHGLANAVFWMIGLDPAKDLLHNYSPTMDSFWFHFVQHVNGVMHEYGYLLRKLKCQDILEMDDSLPVVVQLRGGDKSESHSVCIYDGSIYDSASRFVLVKSRETLNWCGGDYGFAAHVRLYRLQLNLKVKGVEQKKVKAKRPRSG